MSTIIELIEILVHQLIMHINAMVIQPIHHNLQLFNPFNPNYQWVCDGIRTKMVFLFDTMIDTQLGIISVFINLYKRIFGTNG